ncbi:MAG: hypothetical protein ASARMPRED_001505 [Alectoria sarmentosa]|nr:MAG: hypothetical protein ASARMPRED_001505 [Alectoria sarmentosa]
MAQLVITKDNATPLIEIATWFCLTVTILTVIARLITKHYTLRHFNLDDYFISISLVFTSAQSGAILIAASKGLGQRLDSLSSSQVSSLLKSQYASTFLFVASVYFAKLSLISYLRGLSLSKIDRRSSLVIGWVVTLWAAIAILTTGFQCHLPRSWDFIHNACFNRTSWAYFVAIVNGLTDITLVILPSMIVLRLKVAARKKAILLVFFMARLTYLHLTFLPNTVTKPVTSVIAAIIPQITYLDRTSHTPDPTHSTWPVIICTQIIQCLSIVTACVVYLKPFLDSIQTGFIQVDDLRRRQLPGFGYRLGQQEQKGVSLHTKYAMGIPSPWSKWTNTESQRSADVELQRNANAGLQELGTKANAGAGRCDEWNMGGDEDGEAHGRNRIVCTTTVIVRDQDRGDGG